MMNEAKNKIKIKDHITYRINEKERIIVGVCDLSPRDFLIDYCRYTNHKLYYIVEYLYPELFYLNYNMIRAKARCNSKDEWDVNKGMKLVEEKIYYKMYRNLYKQLERINKNVLCQLMELNKMEDKYRAKADSLKTDIKTYF